MNEETQAAPEIRRFFIPPWLDDLDVKAMPFRILCHLLRRAGEDGRCYPSAPTIASACRCHVDTVWPHVRTLEKAGIIKRLPKKFQGSNCYLVTPPITGKTPVVDDLPITGKTPVPITGKTPVPITGKTPVGRKPSKESLLKKSNPLGDAFQFDDFQKNDHDVFVHWNAIQELPKVKAISADRKKKLAARLKDLFFRENWKAAIDITANSQFLTGQNDRGWKADIDWFLKPDSVVKIMEGKYTPSSSNRKPERPGFTTVNGQTYKTP